MANIVSFPYSQAGMQFQTVYANNPLQQGVTYYITAYDDTEGSASSSFTVAGETITATPAISPYQNPFIGSSTTVTMSCATSGSEIRYTLDASTPTSGSTLYSSLFTVTADSTVIRAIGIKSGLADSAIAGVVVTHAKVANAIISPSSGKFYSPISVSISCPTSGSAIYYTDNGTTPTTGSTLYSTPFTVFETSSTEPKVIKAIGAKSGWLDSTVTSSVYTVTLSAPVITPSAGTYTGSVLITITNNTTGASIRYTDNGSAPTYSSSLYSEAFSITESKAIKAFVQKDGYNDSTISVSTYSIMLVASTPTINIDGGSFYVPVGITLASSTSGADIRYTTNGSNVSSVSQLYSGLFTISDNTQYQIKAITYKTGYVASEQFASNTYSFSVATPTMSPAGGTFSGGATVTISCETPGVTIRVATGLTPLTSSSTIYTEPFIMRAHGTVSAVATKENVNAAPTISFRFSNSAVSTHTMFIRSIGGNGTTHAEMMQCIASIFAYPTLTASAWIYIQGGYTIGLAGTGSLAFGYGPNIAAKTISGHPYWDNGYQHTITFTTDPSELSTPATIIGNTDITAVATELLGGRIEFSKLNLIQTVTTNTHITYQSNSTISIKDCFIATNTVTYVSRAKYACFTMNNCTAAIMGLDNMNSTSLDGFRFSFDHAEKILNSIICVNKSSLFTIYVNSVPTATEYRNNTIYNYGFSNGITITAIDHDGYDHSEALVNENTIIGNPTFSCGSLITTPFESAATVISRLPLITSLSTSCLQNANSIGSATDINGKARK